MAVLALDTTLEAERVLVRLWRARSASERVERWLNFQRFCWNSLWQVAPERALFWRRWHGLDSTPPEEFLQPGTELAFVDPVQLAEQVNDALRHAGCRCMVVGSVASSFYGESRQTQDVDMLVEFAPKALERIIPQLQNDFYLSEAAATEALRRRSSFNLIHFNSSTKIDLFVSKGRPYDLSSLARSRIYREALRVASPEDVVLAKFEWYRASQGVLERQWRDILSVLAVSDVDQAYLRHWAGQLNVLDLPEKALTEVEPLR